MKTMSTTFGIMAVLLFFLGAFAGYFWGVKFTPSDKTSVDDNQNKKEGVILSEKSKKLLSMYESPFFDHLKVNLVGRINKKGDATIFFKYKDTKLAFPITNDTDFKKIVQPEGEKSRIKPMNPNHLKRGDIVILSVELNRDNFYINQITRKDTK